jgi:hypothetical protein
MPSGNSAIPSHRLGGAVLERRIRQARSDDDCHGNALMALVGVSMLSEAAMMAVLAVQGQLHYTTLTVEGQRLSFSCGEALAPMRWAIPRQVVPEIRKEAILATTWTASQRAPHLCMDGLSLYRLQVLVNQADGDCTLAYGRSHAPHRAVPNITGGKDAWNTGLQ